MSVSRRDGVSLSRLGMTRICGRPGNNRFYALRARSRGRSPQRRKSEMVYGLTEPVSQLPAVKFTLPMVFLSLRHTLSSSAREVSIEVQPSKGKT
ncbi:hypothetical protein ElyMa_001331100 [Elysia marginata]|uniref:Uncharacterized protein n=1 Tax=Elysia marginata TaxID=1093978 RepID=A0AAV4IET6_9GAST|nr:hypothetical protein ElyMa_001331100 [Elysia marginata]